MAYTYTTKNPPPATREEKAKFWFGRSNTQHARKNKETGEIELWWTGDAGYWSQAFCSPPQPFICKPALNTPDQPTQQTTHEN